MPGKTRTIVLDSWAVLAYLEDDRAGRQVSDMIIGAHERGVTILMSVVNAAEVWYFLARKVSAAEADRGVNGLGQIGIRLVDADWNLARTAGIFKSAHRMSLADCFAAALAKKYKAELVTGDKEFKKIEHDIAIVWL
jgi:predicted nucleic acid-binding protein